MSDDTGLGRVVLGLDGFALTEVELVGGEAWLHVETEPTTVVCPDCGVIARADGRRPNWLRELPVAGRAAVLVWHKRVWRCHERLCGRATWTERPEDVACPRYLLTERARAEICRQVARGRSVADLAASFGCGWHTAMSAVWDHGQPAVYDPARIADVRALGVDEATFTDAGPRRARFVAGLVDLGRGRLLDVVDGRAGSAVTGWRGQPRPRVAVNGRARRPRPVPRLLQRAGRRLQRARSRRRCLPRGAVGQPGRRSPPARATRNAGHRGRKGDRLYGIRRVLITGHERLSARGRRRLHAGLTVGDPHEEVWYAHVVTEQLRAVDTAGDETTARQELADFYDFADAAGIPECDRLRRTIRPWESQVLAYYRSDGLSNAACESTNALIKKIKRVGHGFRNLWNCRLRLLLHCGGISWHDQTAAHI